MVHFKLRTTVAVIFVLLNRLQKRRRLIRPYNDPVLFLINTKKKQPFRFIINNIIMLL